MKIEEIKRQMLSEHQLLRGMLDVVTGLAEKVAAANASLVPALRDSARQLTEVVVNHMESEEQHLAELSRGGNPHWARQLTEFKHQHFHQRLLLAHFIERMEIIQASKRLGEVVQAVVMAIQFDMEHEEKALFDREPGAIKA